MLEYSNYVGGKWVKSSSKKTFVSKNPANGKIIGKFQLSTIKDVEVAVAAAKSALHGATKSLAQELASRGITVNAIAPGIIQGKMSNTNFDPSSIKSMVPMKRAGKPEEVAALVNFLCSDEAAYISGQIIGINGGMA